LGGRFGVSTGREQTVYTANVFSKDADKALEILADVIANSTYESADKERANVLTKIADHDEQYCVVDHLHQTAFMGTSLSRNVHGSAAAVANINKDRLVEFSKANYTGNKIVVSAAGDIDQARLVDLSEKALGGIASSSAAAKAPGAAIFTGSDKRIRFDSAEVSMINYLYLKLGEIRRVYLIFVFSSEVYEDTTPRV
jgi:processing peptidase subunit beta